MKKSVFTFLFAIASLPGFAQALHVYHDGESTPDVIAQASIGSIYFEPKFGGSEEYQWVLNTLDGEKQYDVVDSVKFNLPHLTTTLHTYYVPSDYGSLRIFASCHQGATPPILTFADGTTSSPFQHDKNGLYGWDYWVAYDNGAGDSNVRTETWYVTNGEVKDSIIIHYTGLPYAENAYTEICFSADETEYIMNTNLPDPRLNFDAEGISWYYDESGKPVLHLSRNETGEMRRFNLGLYLGTEVGGFQMGSGYVEQLGTPFLHTPEEHMAALREFCDSTNFASWGKNTNWWSDEPLWKWDYCINNYKWSNYYWHINDHIVNLFFGGGQYTGVHGTLPASFEVIMDDIQGELDLTQCALYGKIPYNIRHHKKWAQYGWNFIQQMSWFGGGFDMEDINLRIDDVEVEDFVNNTTSTTYEMLSKNKITWVFNGGAVDMIGGISDERVNKYLDYRDKGLGVVVTVGGFWDTPYDNYRNYVLGQQSVNGLPKSIVWTKGFDKADIGAYGSMSLLDSEGNLLWYSENDGGLSESFYHNSIDSICRKYLGEPSEHETYISTHYKSTDYSHDGEVLTLQKATVGRGIDLVFMGDQYVDTLLVEGGQFEQDMYASMEYFFEIEPYKSLRERFNVYAVKAVSPNGYDGTEHKFNFNNDLVFEYARKVPDVDMDNVSITVIHYNPNYSFFVSGETAMWESGASIAYIEEGGPSNIICHETGGHGFAKLLDEYIYAGYEDNHTQEGANESFREWIKTVYHDQGWGMNVSATDNPEEVPWAHFLKDERYKDEVGIYQGAWYWPKELWRASENSVMNSDYTWFNAPSREAIYKRAMQLSEGEDWAYDYETFVAFDAPVREAHKQAVSNARGSEADGQNVQKCSVKMRPPTLFKGSWKNGSKYEIDKKKFVKPNTPMRKVERKQTDSYQQNQRPYIYYKGQRYDVDEYKNKIVSVH